MQVPLEKPKSVLSMINIVCLSVRTGVFTVHECSLNTKIRHNFYGTCFFLIGWQLAACSLRTLSFYFTDDTDLIIAQSQPWTTADQECLVQIPIQSNPIQVNTCGMCRNRSDSWTAPPPNVPEPKNHWAISEVVSMSQPSLIDSRPFRTEFY